MSDSPPRARVVTEPLGGSPLSLAVQAGKLPAALQPWRPATVAEWRAHVERCRLAVPADWFARLKSAFNPAGAAAVRLERVIKARGVVVTTGQQPGLFGGPIYTLSKALTALELADAIEQSTGIPAAPVFWAATDDSDFAEASVAWLSDVDGLHQLTHSEKPPAGTPMSGAALGDLTAHIDRLRAACGSAPNTEYLESAAKAYSAGTIGGAYLNLLHDLLEPLGIAVFDASSSAYHDAARPVLLDALTSAAKISSAASARAVAIRDAGFEPQVEDDRGLSLVFAIEKGIKRRLSVAEAGKPPAAALAPNVLLRPLVEREILPTIAYVAGPGEIAYFVQSNAVAEALGRERPVVVPRWSCSVVEPFVERAAGRLGVQLGELKDLHAVEKRLARTAVPESVMKAWSHLNEQVRESVRALGRAVEESKLMPAPVIQGLHNSLGHRLGRAERRILAAAKRRDERVRRDLIAAAAAIWPNGKRQERVLNFIPMLTRGGEALVSDMRKAARAHAKQLLG